MRYIRTVLLISCLPIIGIKVHAPDLDPRAYARIPVNMAFLVSGFGYSFGRVLTDPVLPLQDLSAAVESPSIAGGYTFSLLDRLPRLQQLCHMPGHS